MGNETSKQVGASSPTAAPGHARRDTYTGTLSSGTKTFGSPAAAATSTTAGSTAGGTGSPRKTTAPLLPSASSPSFAPQTTPSLPPVEGLGPRSASIAIDAGNSGCGGGGVGAGSPAGASVPRYVGSNSMVYTLPSFTSETVLGGAGGSAMVRSQPIAMPKAASTQLPLVSSGSDFRMGAPSSPLSPSRRHFPAPGVSTPIAIPTYNTSTTAMEELSCTSPVLKSYRQASFSQSRRDACLARSPTSPPVTFMSGSSFCAGAPDGPVVLSTVASSSPGGGSGGSPSAGIHTRFLEITGHPLGLENYGSTCYCNSVIQLIYHCTPLRLRLLELHDVYLTKRGKAGFEEGTVLHQLCNLIAVMHKSNNRSKDKYAREKIAPKDLLTCVRAKNEVFNNDMQQDAHEFTMFLLNDIIDTEQRIMADPANINLFLQHEASMKKKGTSTFAFWKSSKDKSISSGGAGGGSKAHKSEKASSTTTPPKSAGKPQQPFTGELTPLQVILQGQFGSLTACLECESVTARDEVFIDLSLETAQGTSLLRCLDHFGDPEYFWGKNKLRCDACKTSVRAAKTIHVQQLPQYALLIHLKRFQYDVKRQNFTKKADHVALPMQMDVEEYLTDPEVIEQSMRNEQARSQQRDTESTTGSKKHDAAAAPTPASASPDTFKPAPEEVRRKLRGIARHKARFELTGFVAHIGEGPNSGHYFTCVRYGPQLWRRFDDDTVSTMAERDVQQYFGVPSEAAGVVTITAYILLYERVA